MSLQAALVHRNRLAPEEPEAMLKLHRRFFCNVAREVFMADLLEKDWVILLRDAAGQLRGFSTIQLLRLPMPLQDHVVLFSGDTIVDRQCWGESTLAGAFGHLLVHVMERFPRHPKYWFLISKGYRTYRFLPVYFRRFYPACHQERAASHGTLLHAVARYKFAGAYDAASGLIRFGGLRDRLIPELCEIPPGRQRDPHVAFFLARNPRFAEGDELACLAEISADNLNERAWRMIWHSRVTWHRVEDVPASVAG